MPILFFGTYDERTHPRVQVLREGFLAHGYDVAVANAPLDFGTAERVKMAARPWTAPRLGLRILRRWFHLWRATRGTHPDVVVVGYLGHLDVHLARWRFRHATLVLDHLVGLGDTVRDRQVGEKQRVDAFLDRVDRAALRAADVVLVDTDEQAAALSPDARAKAVVVPVGAPSPWFTVDRPATASDEPLRLVFFGLFTPLQGAPVIGAALRSIPDARLTCTMAGTGQDLTATRAAVGEDDRVTWTAWVDADALPGVVAQHDVCLGIFGDGDKARRVVPNKVFQGAAAGCAIVTSDTPPQRRLLEGRAVLVPPGDASALAEVLVELAGDRARVADLQAKARELAEHAASPAAVVQPLLDRLAT